MNRRLPVRWRLTLWFSTLLAVTLLLLAGTVFFELRARLYAEFDDQLQDQVALTLASVDVQNGGPVFNETVVHTGDFFRRLFDTTGRIGADNSASFGGVPLDPAAVAAALEGKTTYTSLTTLGAPAEPSDPADQGDQRDPPHEALRVITAPVRGGPDNAIVGALQLGSDRDDVDGPLAQLLVVLAMVSPLALVAAAAGGYLLAGRALAPVAAITDLAARIGARDLHARLQLDLPDDELGRLVSTFNAMLNRIEEAFARQRQFTADAAHELRTPLSLMRAQVDLALARPRSTVAYREALRGLDRDLGRLTGLVSSLLVLARTESGQLVPERSEFDLRETIEAINEQYAPLAREAGVVLHADTGPARIEADEDLLVQVLVNLVDNAITHTPPAGSVTVGCHTAGSLVHLWVSDTGCGIPAADQARVFDRFYRVDVSRARANGGAGLGLAICKAIVEAHHGTLTLSSQVGEGTRVALALPRQNGVPRASR